MADNELTDLTRRLASLTPAGQPPDRDQLLVTLGRAQAPVRRWQIVTLGCALLSAVLGWRLLTREPVVIERVVTVPAEVPEVSPVEPPPRSPGDYGHLLKLIEAGGIEALPPPVPPNWPTKTITAHRSEPS